MPDELKALPAQAWRALRGEQIETIESLCNLTPEQVLGVPNIGIKFLKAIQTFLSEHGRALRQE